MVHNSLQSNIIVGGKITWEAPAPQETPHFCPGSPPFQSPSPLSGWGNEMFVHIRHLCYSNTKCTTYKRQTLPGLPFSQLQCLPQWPGSWTRQSLEWSPPPKFNASPLTQWVCNFNFITTSRPWFIWRWTLLFKNFWSFSGWATDMVAMCKFCKWSLLALTTSLTLTVPQVCHINVIDALLELMWTSPWITDSDHKLGNWRNNLQIVWKIISTTCHNRSHKLSKSQSHRRLTLWDWRLSNEQYQTLSSSCRTPSNIRLREIVSENAIGFQFDF